MTKQRALIKKIVYDSYSHPTAVAIYEEAKKVLSSIALGTVYRNLNLMVESGEIRRISIPGQPDRFDKTLTPHGHMRCTECGRVFDFFIDNLERDIHECTGADVLSFELSAQIICADCIKKRTASCS